MTDTAIVPRRNGGQPEMPAPLIDEQLADQLLGKAQAQGVELLGPDGLLSQVTKAVLDLAVAVALGGDCLADAAVLRAEPGAVRPGGLRTVIR